MIVYLMEAKLKEVIQIMFYNDYSIWRKERKGKGGGGKMIMMR